MTYSVGANAQASELNLLNRVLMMSGLRPVPSLDSIETGSDAWYAHFWLNDVLRREMEKGWYLFNKVDCAEYEIGAGGVIAIPEVHRWEISRETYRNLFDFPATLYRSSPNQLTGSTPKDVETLQKHVGQKVYLDLVLVVHPYLGTDRQAPDVFLNHCAAKAAYEFAPQVGGVPTKEVIQDAADQLIRAEAAVTPRANVFNDSPGSFMTWADR